MASQSIGEKAPPDQSEGSIEDRAGRSSTTMASTDNVVSNLHVVVWANKSGNQPIGAGPEGNFERKV